MASFTIPGHLAPAYGECLRMAQTHYENFPVASFLISKALRPHIAALYAFARTADDLADEEAFKGNRLKHLRSWERALHASLRDGPAPPVLKAFSHTMRTFDIPVKLPLALLKAFRMDTKVRRYPTWDRLLYYCRHSADPVGRMVLLIHGIREERLHRFSDFLCSGLQLVNFWQDSSVDLRRGRIYYPRSEWRKAGVTERVLLARRDTDATRALVKNAVDFTEGHVRQSLPLLDAVQGRLRLELRATYLGGLGILAKVRALDHNVMDQRPAWSPWEKVRLAVKAILPGFGGDHE